MWFRIYFLVRSCFNYSIYTDAYSKKLCKSYGINDDVKWTLKCYINKKPEKTVCCLFVCSTLILSYVLRIFEMPFFRINEDEYPIFDSFFNSMWCIWATMTTVGYGDISPSTIPGRCIAMVTALWGTFLISLMVVIVTNIFQLNQK